MYLSYHLFISVSLNTIFLSNKSISSGLYLDKAIILHTSALVTGILSPYLPTVAVLELLSLSEHPHNKTINNKNKNLRINVQPPQYIICKDF